MNYSGLIRSVASMPHRLPLIFRFYTTGTPSRETVETPSFKGNVIAFLPTSTSFEKHMQKRAFFADKSHFLRSVGERENVIFCRPRRFGKSLILQMFRQYFDVKTDDKKFEELFGHLWIGQKDANGTYLNKTNDQGKYHVLPLEMSSLRFATSDSEDLVAQKFDSLVINQVKRCARGYNLPLSWEPESAANAIEVLDEAARKAGHPLYAFVDEYDSPFMNFLMSSNMTPKDKRRLLDPLRLTYGSFLASLKSTRTRLFMTGIMDLYIPTFTGHTFTRASLDPAWAAFSGYTDDDVKNLLSQVCALLPTDDPRRQLLEGQAAQDFVKESYNGYWFAKEDRQQPKMYNADMVNSFVRFVLTTGRLPQSMELVSSSTSISNNVLGFTQSIPRSTTLISVPAVDLPVTLTESLAQPLNVEKILNVYESHAPDATDMFYKILYLNGALTTGTVGKDGSGLTLKIPNKVAGMEFMSSIRESLGPALPEFKEAIEALATFIHSDNPTDLAEALTKHQLQVTVKPNGTDVSNSESHFQLDFLVSLNLGLPRLSHSVKVFNQHPIKNLENQTQYTNPFDSYLDLMLAPEDPSQPARLIELKNVSLAQLFPEKENYQEKIMRDGVIQEESVAQILERTFHYTDMKNVRQKATIGSLVNEGIDQVAKYQALVKEQDVKNKKVRAGGYTSWVFLRVGLSRVLAFNQKVEINKVR